MRSREELIEMLGILNALADSLSETLGKDAVPKGLLQRRQMLLWVFGQYDQQTSDFIENVKKTLTPAELEQAIKEAKRYELAQ